MRKLEEYFELIKTERKKKGDSEITVETYKPLDDYDLYIDAIDINSGLIRKCRISFMTKHYPLHMYRIWSPSLDELLSIALPDMRSVFSELLTGIATKLFGNNNISVKRLGELTFSEILGYAGFEPFYASDDHSLLVYDAQEDKIITMKPEETKKHCTLTNQLLSVVRQGKPGDDLAFSQQLLSELVMSLLGQDTYRYYLIKKRDTYRPPYYREGEGTTKDGTIGTRLKTTCDLIPLSVIAIEEAPDVTIGYDFTVDNFKTFALADGIFVMDTMVVYSILHTQEAAELGKLEYHYVIPRYSFEPAWPIEYDSLLGWYVANEQAKA